MQPAYLVKPAHFTFVNITNDTAFSLTLDVHFLQHTVIDQGNPGF
jgi:hypothetical protein